MAYTGPKYTLGKPGVPQYHLGGYPSASTSTSTSAPATIEWTPAQKQQLTDAYTGIPGNTPTAEMAPFIPKFNPYADVGYTAGASAVTDTNTHAQANHDYNVGSGEQNFGYDANGNPVTSGANYNPYSQAAILQRNYDNTKRGTTNSYAASGQLYAGSLVNAQNTNAYNYNVSDNALKRNANDFYHSNDYSLTQTTDQGAMTLANLLGPAFTNFLNGNKGY